MLSSNVPVVDYNPTHNELRHCVSCALYDDTNERDCYKSKDRIAMSDSLDVERSSLARISSVASPGDLEMGDSLAFQRISREIRSSS